MPYKDRLGGVMELDDVANTIRIGGRGDIHKKHSWDLLWKIKTRQ